MSFFKKMARPRKNGLNIGEYGLIVGILLLALLLRRELLHLRSADFNVYLDPWVNFIRSHGRFASLKYNFSDYDVPYLYLLSLGTFLIKINLLLVKSISIVFDFISALFVYLTVKIKYEKKIAVAIAAGLGTLLLPTIFLNSAAWGQCDSIYASFALGAVYFLLRKRNAWGFIFLGLSFSFKLQALFLFPLVFVLTINRDITFKSLKYIILTPITYFMLLIPAMIAGRPLNDLLHIYLNQSQRPATLTGLAPTMYAWFSTNVAVADASAYGRATTLLAGAVVLVVSFLVLTSHRKIADETCVTLSLLFVTLLPFLLPAMHERYFYLADVFSLVYAFYRPKFFFVAIIVEVTSLLCYVAYLANNNEQIVPLSILAFFTLTTCSIVTYDLVKQLFPGNTVQEEKLAAFVYSQADEEPTHPIPV